MMADTIDMTQLTTLEEYQMLAEQSKIYTDRAVAGAGKVQTNTTEYWNAQTSYIPPEGAIIVYSDYAQETVEGDTVNVPNFKFGDGKAYVVDLPFVSADLRATVEEHINNRSIHLSEADRDKLDESVSASVKPTGENEYGLVLS